MARMIFAVDSKGGVGSLQHRGNVPNRMVASHCVQHIVDKAATMPPTSDKLHNVLLAKRPDAIPDENNITVQGIVEKSETTSATESRLLTAGLQAISTDAGVGALGEFERN